MAIDDDSHIEWQLFIDGPFSLETVLSAARQAAGPDINVKDLTSDWGCPGYTLWSAAMLADVVDGHDYETDGELDFGNLRFLVDLEDHRRPGDGREARRFAEALFDHLASSGARRLLMVDDFQGLVRRFDGHRRKEALSAEPRT